MIENNGLKVIGFAEVVIGKVVQLTEDGLSTEFKLVEYYINEYQTYMSRTIATFAVDPQDSPQKYLKEFKKALGNYVRIKDAYVEEDVMDVLTKM